MQKTKIPTSISVYITLGVLFFVLLILMPRSGKFGYEYKKGAPWAYDNLVAQFDFPILKTSEQLRSELSSGEKSVVPYFKYSEQVSRDNIRLAQSLSFPSFAGLSSVVVSSLSEIYSRGIVPERDLKIYDGITIEPGKVIYIQKDKRAALYPVSNLYTVSSARSKLIKDVSGLFPESNADSLLTEVYPLLHPNLVFDKETTELVHAENTEEISPTSGYMNAGMTIVSKGELVTSDILQMLDSYKAEYENNFGFSGSLWQLWTGNALISILLVIVLFLSLIFTCPEIFSHYNSFLFVVMLVVLAAFSAIFVDEVNSRLLYLVPFSITALYLMAFFRNRVVISIYCISLLPLLIFAHNGLELFMLNLVGGLVAMCSFESFGKGWRQFVSALIVAFALLVSLLAFKLMGDSPLLTDLYKPIYLVLGALLSVALYPLIFLFEKLFGLVSVSRLEDLCDTNNNPLITELATKAPGTFQHSLQVMNLCDAAAKSIDANVALVRAGALYHDIGKIANPQCFIENESLGAKYHSGLSAKESAREIIKHVSDGLAISDKHDLPSVVKAFINTHHGTSCTGYFYNKYLNEGGDPADVADFFYTGDKPVTKEQVILMICDTLEAASRTLKDNTPESFNDFVDRMVQAKIDARQFENAEITIKELGTVKTVLKSYLSQMYHQRVVYPKRKNTRS